MTQSARNNLFLSIGFAILTAISAQISIPIEPVPLTLQTVAIFLIALVLPLKYALLSIIFYILMGLVGLPVFANGRSGISVLTGPTAGFIFGFPVVAIVLSYLTRDIRFNIKEMGTVALYWRVAWSCAIASIMLQVMGMLWGKAHIGVTWPEIVELWLAPFYLDMIIKIFLVTVIAVQIWKQRAGRQ